jgi:hypothetical protein
VCRSNAERKNKNYCPWLWGKAIKADGGTPGPLEASPLSCSPPPSFFFLLALLQGRSVLRRGRGRRPGPSHRPGRPAQAKGRATPSSSPQQEGEAETRRAGPSHTPSRSSRRPGAEGRGRDPDPGAGSRGPTSWRRRDREPIALAGRGRALPETRRAATRSRQPGAEPVLSGPSQSHAQTGLGKPTHLRGNVAPGATWGPRSSRPGPADEGQGGAPWLKLTHTPSRSSRPAPRQQQAQGDEGQGGAPC